MRTIVCLSFLVLAAGCSSVLGPEDLRDPGMRGMVLKKVREAGGYFLFVAEGGEQRKIEVSVEAYRLIGEGDSLPLSGEVESPDEVEEIDEEAAREGDSSEFKPSDLPED
jgi:hypothetical protein